MSIAVRLAAFYVGSFVVVGIMVPFWPLWLAAKGLAPDEIGAVIAASILTRASMAPVLARLADGLGERRRPMVGLALAALAAFLLFGLADGFWSILAVTLVYASLWAPLTPLIESLTVQITRDRGLDYGRIRLWGSLAFIVAAVAVGRALVGGSATLVHGFVAAALAATFVSTLALPDARPPRGAPMRGVELARRPTFVLLLAAAAFVQASHSVYYSFGTLAWQAAGYSEDAIGALWAEGVVAEIVLFASGRRIVARFGAARLIALGGIAGIVRWIATGLFDSAIALVLVQALHAFTFAATHLGAVHFIARSVPPQLSATAQGLYGAVTGLGLGVAAFVSGQLYSAFAAQAYLFMAIASAVGFALAVALGRRSKE